MKKMLKKILTLSLVLIGLSFMPSNETVAQTPGSAAGFASLGAEIGKGIATAQGNQEKAATYDSLGQMYREKVAPQLPTGCKFGSLKACYPYCKYYEYIAEKQSCTLCPLFAIVFNTASKIGATAINAFSNSVVRVVVVAFAIWLAIQILMFASSVETRDLRDLVQSIITQGFLILLVTVIIKVGVANFTNTFIVPVFNTGTSMAKAMYSTCTANQTEESCQETKKIFSQKYDLIKEVDNGLPSAMGHSIVQTMTIMEFNVLKFKALGSAMFCQSWKDGWFIFPHFRYMLIGIALWILSTLIIIVVPFLMIDAVFELSVAAALLPVAVGCYAFKWSRKYTKQVWDTMLHSMFSFVFISAIVLILIGTIQSTVEGGLSFSAPGKFEDMFTSINTSGDAYFRHLMDNLSWASNPFLKIVFIFLLGWTVMKSGKEFANDFATSISSPKGGIGASIGGVAASSAKGGATKLATPFARAAGRKIDGGIRDLVKGTGAIARFSRNRSRKKYAAAVASVPLINGVQQTTDKKGRIITKHGDVITVEDVKKGIKRISTGDVDVILKKDKNGHYRAQMKTNTKAAKNILGGDGSVDFAQMAKIVNNLDPAEREVIETELMRDMAKQRISGYAHDYKRAKLIAPPQIVKRDKTTGEITIKEITDKGEVVFTTQKMNIQSGLMETTVLKIDSKGRATKLYTDGIRNKLEKFELNAGFDATKTNDVEDIYRNQNTSKGIKTSYGYTEYWQNKINKGELEHNEIPQGAMSASEVADATRFIKSEGNEFQKAELKLHFE